MGIWKYLLNLWLNQNEICSISYTGTIELYGTIKIQPEGHGFLEESKLLSLTSHLLCIFIWIILWDGQGGFIMVKECLYPKPLSYRTLVLQLEKHTGGFHQDAETTPKAEMPRTAAIHVR